MIDCTRLRMPVSLFCAALLAHGCVVVTSDDDDRIDSTTTDPGTSGPSTTTPTTATTTPATTGATTGDDDDGTTGGFPEDCTENLVADGGFEGGTPNEDWDEHSDVFGTPICDSSCTDDSGAVPFAGDWFVWFGGLEDRQTDDAWVSQDVEILPDTAHLRFRLAMSGGDNLVGDNVMVVEIDDETVFMVTDLDQPDYEGGYHVVDVDLTPFADGETHTLRFHAEFPGTLLTNFFVDEVQLVSCEDEVGTTGTTGTGTTGTGSTTGVADETGADTTAGEESTTGDDNGTSGQGDNGEEGNGEEGNGEEGGD
jgi:hypothetical protein